MAEQTRLIPEVPEPETRTESKHHATDADPNAPAIAASISDQLVQKTPVVPKETLAEKPVTP